MSQSTLSQNVARNFHQKPEKRKYNQGDFRVVIATGYNPYGENPWEFSFEPTFLRFFGREDYLRSKALAVDEERFPQEYESDTDDDY